jgi:bifunctional DNA-binding transcriptional regulator/antitoxin component of YhaV-PrlF toxin-antitoxin module
MVNTYRGRLVSKNQMTIPVPMQHELGMVQGDELEFVIDNGRIRSVHVLKPVRVELLPDQVLESLKRRKASGSAGRVISHQEVKELSDGKELEAKVPTPMRAAVGDY